HEITKTSHSSGTHGYHTGYQFDVRDSNGNIVGPRHPNDPRMIGGGKGGMLLGDKGNVLKPGESSVDFISLGTVLDMSAPGTYTVQASAHVTNDPNSDVVKSNIITITVVPPDPPADEPK
ncbi:MAG: hypothetical protein WAK26_05900, partial [Terracidiphilus sp.]